MKRNDVVGKVKVKLHSEGGSFNANQFLKAKPMAEKAVYEAEGFDSSFFQGDYKDKQSQLSFDVLKEISIRVAPIAAIIGTRIDQVGTFAKRARDSQNNVGYRIIIRDQTEEPTDAQKEKIREIEDFIYKCGADKDSTRDGFDTFLRKIVRDSLTCDQVNFEITYDTEGKIAAFYAVDVSTVRPVTEEYTPEKEMVEDLEEGETISYVQIIDDHIVSAFTEKEMAFAVRNPRTDVKIQPYGLSEIEMIIRQLTSFLEAEEYNMRFFKQGGMTKGIFNIKKDPSGLGDRNALESFKRQWRTQVTGQKGAWKIPVFQLPGDLEFINVSQSGGEMVFEKWTNYLINMACAVYKIDPAEINFPNNGGAGGRGNSLFSGEESKYTQSKDKGLFPLLQFIENTINKYIVSCFGEQYAFVFVGMNEKSEESKLDIDKKKTESYMTINEVRAENGMPEIEGGDIIANPYYIQGLSQTSSDEGFDFSDFSFDDMEKSILSIDTIKE